MKSRMLLGAIVLLALVTVASGQQTTYKWDIAFANGPDNVVNGISAGGSATAYYFIGSQSPEITFTGSGTFKSCKGLAALICPFFVTGGGTWTDGTTSGTYVVTELISFDVAALPFSLPTDNIGNAANARGGTAILKIHYSDGSQGILVLEGLLVVGGTLQTGVSASKGLALYPAQHSVGCTDGFCFEPGAVFPIFHVIACGN